MNGGIGCEKGIGTLIKSRSLRCPEARCPEAQCPKAQRKSDLCCV
jgi:hypothetical protein